MAEVSARRCRWIILPGTMGRSEEEWTRVKSMKRDVMCVSITGQGGKVG